MYYRLIYVSLAFMMISHFAFGQDENLLGNNKFRNGNLNKAYVTDILSKHPWTLIRIDSTCFDEGISSNTVSNKHLLRIKSGGSVESAEAMFSRYKYDDAKRDILFYNRENDEFLALFLTQKSGIYFLAVRKRRLNAEDCFTVTYTFKQVIK